LADLLGGNLVDSLARKVVSEAEPVTRQIVKEERSIFAEGLLQGIPFAAGAAIAYVGTFYLIPERLGTGKAIGYGASALLMALGAWQGLKHLTVKTPPRPPVEPSALDPVVDRAAQAIVREAEPRIRTMLSEEKTLAASALQTAVPFTIGSGAAFLATLLLVPEDKKWVKILGYSGSAVLLGTGAWVALEKVKGAA
jgi:hypothetical protein